MSEYLFDSRSLVNPAKTVFCAIRTKSADGHNYISDLYNKGVRQFVVERMPDNASEMPDADFKVVENVDKEIEKIASDFRRNDFSGKVIGITGSAGKTVVKEMLYRALTLNGIPASRSPRSWNSRIGAPLSLLEAKNDDKFAIIEVGIDSTGDMDAHAEIIRPDLGVLTAITTEHDGGFENREEKIREKLKLFKHSSIIIYDSSSDDVDSIVKSTFPDKKLIPIEGETPLDTDRLIAEAALRELGYEFDVEAEAVTNRIDVHEGVNNCVMLFDDFTNDLRSLRWSLDFMRRRSSEGRKATLIMSDLFHGKMSTDELEVLYGRLAVMLEVFGVGRLVAIGSELKRYSHLFSENISVENVDSAIDFLARYDITRFSSETILITGSPREEFREIKNVLESPRHDTILEVNLDALVHNFNYYRSMLKPSTGLVGMIKASAYGTGAVEVAKTLQSQGASYLAVAVIDEGIELRRAGITMPIMVLNPVTNNYRALFRYSLEPSVFSLRELDILVEEARRAGITRFPAHIKLDTGMHRVGFTSSEVEVLIKRLVNTPELMVSSIFSHLATADCPDEGGYTAMQLEQFETLSSQIIESLPYPVKRHILNTAGIATHPEAQYDLVRLGIGLYGINPVDGEGLRPVASLKTTVISLKNWPAGTTVGYGRRGRLNRDSVIATLPIGYADGLDRHLSCGAAHFLVRGVKCPVVGNICMDQCMIDVTDVPEVAIGDEVEIFGNNMPVEAIAEKLGTIPYEVLTSVSPRVRRIYFRD